MKQIKVTYLDDQKTRVEVTEMTSQEILISLVDLESTVAEEFGVPLSMMDNLKAIACAEKLKEIYGNE